MRVLRQSSCGLENVRCAGKEPRGRGAAGLAEDKGHGPRAGRGGTERRVFLRKLFYPLHIKVPIQALATVLIAVVAWNVYKTGEPEFRQMAPPPAEIQEAPQAQAPPEAAPAAGPAKRDESPATPEKKAFAPPPAQVQEPSPQGAATDREETVAEAEKPLERLRAAKGAAGPAKDEDAPRGPGAARPGEADRVLEARDQKQKAVKAPVGAVAKEAEKQEARPAASPTMSAAVDFATRSHGDNPPGL